MHLNSGDYSTTWYRNLVNVGQIITQMRFECVQQVSSRTEVILIMFAMGALLGTVSNTANPGGLHVALCNPLL